MVNIATMYDSAFCESLSFLNSMNQDYANAKCKLIKSIRESQSSDISDFVEFFDDVDSMVQSFIKHLESLYKKYHATMSVNVLKYKRTLSSKLKKIQPLDGRIDIKYDDKFIKYRIESNIPCIDIKSSWFNELTQKIRTDYSYYFDVSKQIYQNRDIDHTSNALELMYKNTANNLEDFENQIRRDTLKTDVPISKANFGKVLYSVFRPEILDGVLIDYSILNACASRIDTIESHLKEIEKQFKEIANDYKSIVNFKEYLLTDNFSTSLGVNICDNEAFRNNLEAYLKLKTEELNSMKNIHLMAISAKLDACKECAVQDMKIIDYVHDMMVGSMKGE